MSKSKDAPTLSEQVKDSFNTFGVSPDWKPLTKKQWHGTRYIEWDVPKPIYKKLCKMIGKEIKKFNKNCQCEYCVNDRKNKNHDTNNQP